MYAKAEQKKTAYGWICARLLSPPPSLQMDKAPVVMCMIDCLIVFKAEMTVSYCVFIWTFLVSCNGFPIEIVRKSFSCGEDKVDVCVCVSSKSLFGC